jgi:HNH endonuclease
LNQQSAASHVPKPSASEETPSLTDQCVFTIRNLSDLNSAFQTGGIGQFTENKPWLTARKTLKASKETGERVPIFFSDADHTGFLHYWAFLTAIEVVERKTTYHFEQLRRFAKKPKQSVLRIASGGERLSPNHRRPYVLCSTPGPESSLLSQMFVAEHPTDDVIPTQFDLASIKDEREQAHRAITIRRGQPTFRKKLIAAYKGKCAVTGCDASDALEAAHISPYCGKQSNHVANGVLLRADLHTLFDLNLIGIEPTTATIRLAPELRQTSYADLQGKKLAVPRNLADRPSREALVERWQQFSINGKKPKE